MNSPALLTADQRHQMPRGQRQRDVLQHLAAR